MRIHLQRASAKLLCAIAICGAAASACGLTIAPTFDSTISANAKSGPAMEAAINAAIKVFETNYADNFSINITFMVNTNVGLAQSDNSYVYVTYANYLAALKTHATSANDKLALSQLPNTAQDPVVGGTQMLITVPLASLLGLTGSSPDGAVISFNTNLLSFTRPDPNSLNLFDMQSAAEHEIDEVLGGGGAGCNLNEFPQIGATDLFRYATNSANSKLARTWTLNNGDNAFFSVDGTNLWARFNQDPDADLGDFWGFNQDPTTYLPLYFSPPGVTPHAEVQDAYATPSFFSYPTNFTYFPTTNYYYENTSPDLGTNELTMLDVIGWTLVAPPPTLAIVKSGATHIMLSWPSNDTGFTLQETTNLMSNSWVASATGSTNPAVIQNPSAPKFYRLHQSMAPASLPVGLAQVQPLTTGPIIPASHVWMPRSILNNP